MERFIVVSIADAVEKDYPLDEWTKGLFKKYQDYYWCLFETDGEKPVRLVGTDHMEPEDAILVRDLSWVVKELNKLAEGSE